MSNGTAESQTQLWESANDRLGSVTPATTTEAGRATPPMRGSGTDSAVTGLRRRLSLSEAMDLLEVEAARRQLAERKFRESEERFRQLSEHVGLFLWLSDAQTQELIYVSPGFEQVWNRCREAKYRLPEDWQNDTPPGKRHRAQGMKSQQMSAAGQNQNPEYQIAGPDGSPRWIRDRMFPVQDESGETLYTLGIAEDVTELKRLAIALRDNDLRGRALLSLVPDMVLRLKRDGTILEFKPAKECPWLLPTVELVGRKLKDFLPDQVLAQANHFLQLTLETGLTQTFTCQYLLPDQLRDFEARSVSCGPDEVLALVRDVTERKRLEKEILEISSQEQQRIGQDLHDGLGQHLTGITFLSKALERKLAARSLEEAADAAEIGRLVLQALAQTRNLARGLFPAELERNGIVSALRELVANVERVYQLKCQLRCADGVEITNNVVATHLFRITQEAINNSIKHGKAQHIAISMEGHPGAYELRIEDDGTGLPVSGRSDGLGLKIMQYRARRLGGTFEIQPVTPAGTRVTIRFSALPKAGEPAR
jgi:PAS domain S-box-containing protein